MKYAATALLALFTLAACTTTDEIIIDQKGVNMAAYQQDLECKSYSASVNTGEKAAVGAATGAVVGGLVGAITGGGEGAAKGAGIGAVGGGAKGAGQGAETEVQVVKNCLRGRGYRVLN